MTRLSYCRSDLGGWDLNGFSMYFYTRPACPLCEEALPIARAVSRFLKRNLEVVDIETDDHLIAEYGLRIPVLTTGAGRVVAEGHIEFWPALRRTLLSG